MLEKFHFEIVRINGTIQGELHYLKEEHARWLNIGSLFSWSMGIW